MKKQKNNPAENYPSSETQMLYPNCSEMVFRLSGDLEEIRTQMYNILDWTIGEYTGKYGDGDYEEDKEDKEDKKELEPLHPNIQRSVDEIREKIKNATTLEDFEQIVIEFTCNYETFFKVDEDNGLLVATCNNYGWSNVVKEEVYEEDRDYYTVAGYTHYILQEVIDGYEIYKREYDDASERGMPEFVFPDKGFKISLEDSDVKFVIRGDNIFLINNNNLIKIPEVKDEEMLNKLKLLMNL